MRPEDEFFDVIEEFEEGSSEGYFPPEFPRIPDPGSVPVPDRFCVDCGTTLPEKWAHNQCPECLWWLEMMFPEFLAADNLEYQQYLRSLESDPEPEQEPEADDEPLPFHPDFV